MLHLIQADVIYNIFYFIISIISTSFKTISHVISLKTVMMCILSSHMPYKLSYTHVALFETFKIGHWEVKRCSATAITQTCLLHKG